MARRYSSEESKRRILSACVRLFLEKGYSSTTMTEILRAADVTSSTFQNIFRTKDRVLLELVGTMFANQFEVANELVGDKSLSPAYIYAAEIAVQLALVEVNENLRDIYVEAYTFPEAARLIQKKTAQKSMKLFEKYVPDFAESDFYETDVGLTGIMRNYMATKSDMYFTLENKFKRFITMSFGIYKVPEEETKEVVDYVMRIDIKEVAGRLINKLFESLAMKYELQ